jgi:SAM-dependent methyltransferase
VSDERDEKDIFLGMPGYGQLTAGAARGFWRATARPNRMWFHYNQGSLLAANFNHLWCKALNLAAEGRPPKYFAMQHADIEPEDFWLDKLIEELEAKGLDVLGVPAPIKDAHGLTSIALARDDGDRMSVHCRLTTAEIQRLPETFTTADIPGQRPLLLNTGLWVCKFNLDWARLVHFTINDEIVKTPDGRFVALTEPEDWYFSRLCHEIGLKIGCTRKVMLTHAGETRFRNWEIWGEPYDVAYVKQSIFDEAHQDWFPHDAAGWLTETEGEELRRLAEGKVVLEIGAYCGRSTICLAQDASQVYSVDTFDGRGTPTPGDTRGTFTRNIARFGLSEKVKTIVGESQHVVPKLPAVFDLVFIDGGHDYETVSRDIELAMDVLKPDGLLAFHDYETNEPGVTAAVDELCGAGGELLRVAGSLAVVRPPARVLMETH